METNDKAHFWIILFRIGSEEEILNLKWKCGWILWWSSPNVLSLYGMWTKSGLWSRSFILIHTLQLNDNLWYSLKINWIAVFVCPNQNWTQNLSKLINCLFVCLLLSQKFTCKFFLHSFDTLSIYWCYEDTENCES